MATATVLLQGGWESTVALYWAMSQGFDSIALATITTPVDKFDRSAVVDKIVSRAGLGAAVRRTVALNYAPIHAPSLAVLGVALDLASIMGVGPYALVASVHAVPGVRTPNKDDAFRDTLEKAANRTFGLAPGDLPAITLNAPTVTLNRAQAIAFAQNIPGCFRALELTQDEHQDERDQVFLAGGVPDPAVILAWKQGKIKMPSTDNYLAVRAALALDPSE